MSFSKSEGQSDFGGNLELNVVSRVFFSSSTSLIKISGDEEDEREIPQNEFFFRIRRGRRKKHLRLIYTGLASTKGKYIHKFQSEEDPVCTTVSFVFNSHDFKHFLAGICEYFNLGRG